MGKVENLVTLPGPPPYEGPASSSHSAPVFSSSVSLHSLDPPQYRDEPDEPVNQDITVDGAIQEQTLYLIPGALEPTKDGEIRTLHPKLSQDASLLYALIQAQAKIPPRPVFRMTGTHRHITKQDNKEQETTVTDFDIRVDCSYFFRRQQEDENLASDWYYLGVVRDTEMALRGGLYKRRLREPGPTDTENVLEMDIDDRIRLWCHSFCAAASHRWFPLVFRFRRHLVRWDTSIIKEHLTASVRATGYRGDISMSFNSQNPGFSVYSAHWMNRARHNNWIWWACVILPFWIICWPMLLLCTGTFDGVNTSWLYSKCEVLPNDRVQAQYASESEAMWLQKWGEAITEAAFAKREDWLNEGDLLAMRRERERLQGRQQPQQTGNSFVDTAVGVFTGIHGAMRDSDRITGWGGHTRPRRQGINWTITRTSNSHS